MSSAYIYDSMMFINMNKKEKERNKVIWKSVAGAFLNITE